MEGLRQFDFHRKVPRDVTEATSIGGCVSVAAAAVAVWLLMAQVGTFFSTTTTTRLYLDVADSYRSYANAAAGLGLSAEQRHTHPLLVSFNITLPHVPCSVLALDVTDHRGLRRCAQPRAFRTACRSSCSPHELTAAHCARVFRAR